MTSFIFKVSKLSAINGNMLPAREIKISATDFEAARRAVFAKFKNQVKIHEWRAEA